MKDTHRSRRDFFALSTAVAAISRIALAAPQGMKLSLSVRVAEAFDNKEKATLTIDEIIAMAKKYGYEAICMRASQCGVQSPPELIQTMKRKIDAAGLPVSMVTGDFAVPNNNDQGPDCLRKITPYLDLAHALGARDR